MGWIEYSLVSVTGPGRIPAVSGPCPDVVCNDGRRCIIPSGFTGPYSIGIYDLFNDSAVAVSAAIPAYYSAYLRIISVGKPLRYCQVEHLIGIH